VICVQFFKTQRKRSKENQGYTIKLNLAKRQIVKTSKLLKIMRIMSIMGIRVPTKHPFNPRDLRAIKFYSLTRCWKSKAL